MRAQVSDGSLPRECRGQHEHAADGRGRCRAGRSTHTANQRGFHWRTPATSAPPDCHRDRPTRCAAPVCRHNRSHLGTTAHAFVVRWPGFWHRVRVASRRGDGAAPRRRHRAPLCGRREAHSCRDQGGTREGRCSGSTQQRSGKGAAEHRHLRVFRLQVTRCQLRRMAAAAARARRRPRAADAPASWRWRSMC